MKTRLYAVSVTVGTETRDHLVDASSPHTARRHVAAKYTEAKIASGQDVAKLMAKGVKPESAAAEPEQASGQATIPESQNLG